MIKLEEHNFHAEGSGSLLINEAGLIIYRVAQKIAEEGLDTHEDVIEKIMDINNIIKLTDAGMTMEEAISVLGLKNKVGIKETR